MAVVDAGEAGAVIIRARPHLGEQSVTVFLDITVADTSRGTAARVAVLAEDLLRAVVEELGGEARRLLEAVLGGSSAAPSRPAPMAIAAEG